MTLVAKYPGKCTTCSGAILAGQTIDWVKGGGAKHLNAGDCAVAPKVVERVFDGQPIADFLTAAKARGLKFPKVRFLAPNDGELVLALAGVKSKAPGSIQVYVNREWRGRIEPDGAVRGQALLGDQALLDTLTKIVADPVKAASAYGALICACSFCGRKLEDDGSVDNGYGPVCAKHYGLPWKRQGVPVLTAVQ